MKFKKCKVCKKKANYYELSPDGATDYFCSKKHFNKYKNMMRKKGIFWRALPLEKIEVKII